MVKESPVEVSFSVDLELLVIGFIFSISIFTSVFRNALGDIRNIFIV
jgi:hypothetical protein